MIAPASLSAFSTAIAPPASGGVAGGGGVAGPGPVQPARSWRPDAGTPTPQPPRPPVQAAPGTPLPRGSLLDLSV